MFHGQIFYFHIDFSNFIIGLLTFINFYLQKMKDLCLEYIIFTCIKGLIKTILLKIIQSLN